MKRPHASTPDMCDSCSPPMACRKSSSSSGDPYQWQVEQTVRAVLQAWGDDHPSDWAICYQSRATPQKWLEPSTEQELERAARDRVAVVVVPIAFVSEHSETLVELDIEYRELADRLGIEGYFRVPAANDDATLYCRTGRTGAARARPWSRSLQPFRRPHLSCRLYRLPDDDAPGCLTPHAPRLVIFDCDGVLIDSEPVVNELVAAELTRLGWPMTAGGMLRALSRPQPRRHGAADRGAGWAAGWPPAGPRQWRHASSPGCNMMCPWLPVRGKRWRL